MQLLPLTPATQVSLFLVFAAIFQDECYTPAYTLQFRQLLHSLFYIIEETKGRREGQQVGSEGRKEKDLGIDEAPGLVDRTAKPVAKGINENVSGIVSLVINKEQSSLKQ
jgi:hypothetical protein